MFKNYLYWLARPMQFKLFFQIVGSANFIGLKLGRIFMLIYMSLQNVQLLHKVQPLHNVQLLPIIAHSTQKYQMHLETVILEKAVWNVIVVVFLETLGIVLFHQLVLRCLSNRFLQIIVEQK